MNNLEIRSAEKQDAQNLISYLNQVGGESDNLLFGADEMKISVKEEEQLIEKITESPKDCLLLGLLDQEIAAVASLQHLKSPRLAHRGSFAISVKKKFNGRGIGTQMMQRILDFAKCCGYQVVELQVRSDNLAAIALYEKMGFKKIGLYEKYFCIAGHYFDAFYMNIYLDAIETHSKN